MKRTERIEFRVSDDEKTDIEKRAASCSLSTAKFLRSAGLGKEIKSTLDIDAVIELGKVNADLARLGNLMKIALDAAYDQYDKETIKNINNLVVEMRENQVAMKTIILDI